MERRIDEFLDIKPEGTFVFVKEANIRYLIGDYVDGSILVVNDDFKLIVPELMREEAELLPNVEFGNISKLDISGKVFVEKDSPTWLSRKFNAEVSDIVERMRMKKSENEISKLVSAQQKSTDILMRIAEFVSETKGEMSERDVFAYINSYAIENDIHFSFPPIIAFDQSSSRPHHSVSDRICKNIALIDVGVRLDGYCGDITRVVLLKKPTPDVEEDINKVIEIYEESRELLEKGGDTFDHITSMTKSKLGKDFIHSIGHGIGLEVHERPGKDDVLEKNMTITVEPGIYRYRKHGIRIEDMIIIGKGKVPVIDELIIEMY